MSDPVVIRYERQDEVLRITITNCTNHELREVLVGLWARLDDADRADHIRELREYHENPESWMSAVATAIYRGAEMGIDLRALAARGEKVRP